MTLRWKIGSDCFNINTCCKLYDIMYSDSLALF